MRSIVSPLDGIESPFGPKRGLLAFLQKFPGAVAAYSLRDLTGTSPSVLRVRRSSDNAEKDFAAVDVSDASLEAWVGAGSDGFVSVWYDQSVSGNDATQTASASQPQIVDAGTLVIEGGKPALSFDGVDDYLSVNLNSLGTANYSISIVAKISSNKTGYILSSDFAVNRKVGLQVNSSNVLRFYDRDDSPVSLDSTISADNTAIYFFNHTDNKKVIYKNGSKAVEHSITTGSTGESVFRIGMNGSNTELLFVTSEILVKENSFSDSNAIAFQNTINSHYGIY